MNPIPSLKAKNNSVFGPILNKLCNTLKPWQSLPSLLVLLVAVNTQAQDEEEYFTEDVFFSDLQVVTGATHFPQKISDAPTSVTIIDRAMIEASTAREVVDLFRLVPGFQAYFGSAGFGSVNYHGLPHQFSNHLEVKIDGRSVYESLLKGVIWQAMGIELEDIERIEVVRGPNAASDGPNAFKGSINIITRSPVGDRGWSVRTELGEQNTHQMSANYTGVLDQVSYRLTAKTQSSDGFPDFNGEKVDDGSDTDHLGLRAIWSPNITDTVEITLGYSDTELGMTEGGGSDPSSLLRWSFNYNYQYLNWEHRLENNDSVQLLLYHNDLTINVGLDLGLFSEIYGFLPSTLIPGVEDFEVSYTVEDGKSERYEIEGRYKGQWRDNIRFSTGVASRLDQGSGELFFTTTSTLTEESYRAYLNVQADLTDKVVVNGGYLLEYNTTVGTIDAYRLSANYHVNHANSFRVTYNKSVSAPTLLAANDYRTIHSGENILDLDIITNPDLEEEKLRAVEIGYVGVFDTYHLTVDLKIFSEQYRDLIKNLTDNEYPDKVDNRVTYRDNVAWLDIEGFEGQIDYRPSKQWLLAFQYTYTNVDGEYLRKNPIKISNLNDRNSQHVGNLLVQHQFLDSYSISGSYYYQSYVDYDGGAEADSYDRLDIKLAKSFQVGGTNGKVEVIVQNAFGNDYTEFREFNQFETRAFIRMVLNF